MMNTGNKIVIGRMVAVQQQQTFNNVCSYFVQKDMATPFASTRVHIKPNQKRYQQQ